MKSELHSREAAGHGRSVGAAPASDVVVAIAGMRIHAYCLRDVVDFVIAHAARRGSPEYVVTPNAQHVALYQEEPQFRRAYERAFLVVPDGVPLLWAARLLGYSLPGRVNGTDLFEALCAEAAAHGLRVYFLGGREGAARRAAARLRARHPSLQVVGTYCPPFGFERDADRCRDVSEHIKACRPDVLFVGLGAPKQEYWMDANRDKLGVPVSLGIGGSFEFVGGIVARAPRWMQVAGLEWLYRLVAEPRRLWKRYLLGNVAFCFLVARQYLAETIHRRRMA